MKKKKHHFGFTAFSASLNIPSTFLSSHPSHLALIYLCSKGFLYHSYDPSWQGLNIGQTLFWAQLLFQKSAEGTRCPTTLLFSAPLGAIYASQPKEIRATGKLVQHMAGKSSTRLLMSRNRITGHLGTGHLGLMKYFPSLQDLQKRRKKMKAYFSWADITHILSISIICKPAHNH